MNTLELKVLYESLKVEGRSNKCPRRGIYKILNVYEGHWHQKFAMMATVNWKENRLDTYDEEFKVEVQLESFKRNATPEMQEQLRKSVLIGREIKVSVAMMSPTKFYIRWTILPQRTISLDKANSLLQSGSLSFDNVLDQENTQQIDDGGSDDFVDDEGNIL